MNTGFDLVEIIRSILILMPAFLFALVVHEYAHAWMATRFGDNTSEWNGRLTMNPAAHIDPLGTIVFPILSIAMGAHIFFGWARPVPINPNLFRNYRKGMFWVAFAGPLSNILTGFVAAFLLVGFAKYASPSFSLFEPVLAMLQAFLMLNFSLAVFNLIPVPPLDGSNIVLSFLNYNAARKFLAFQQYANILLIFLLFSGALRIIGIPISILIGIAIKLAESVFGFALPG